MLIVDAVLGSSSTRDVRACFVEITRHARAQPMKRLEHIVNKTITMRSEKLFEYFDDGFLVPDRAS